MAWLTSGRFRARILAGLASLCLLAGLAAFSALALAAPEDPVNGIEQAYKGLPFGPDPVPEVQQTYIDYYFKGNANDQTSKAGGISASSATFDQTAPAGPNTIAQQSSWTASATTAGDPRAAYWKGPFTGTFEGDVELRWSWSSPNPVAEFGSDVEVTIFADPSTTQGGGTILGRGIVTPAIKSSPVRSVQKVFAKGTVNSTLLIQVRSRYSDAGNGHQVHYGSQAHPSGFAIPQGPYLPPPKPQTSSTPYSGQMPKVQAVYVGHDALEPTIAVDRQGRAFMAAAGFDQAAGLLGRTDIMRSTDGGLKWQVVTPGLPPAASTPPLTLDPYIYIDEATGRVFSIDLYVGCSYLNVSDNGGQSWTANPFACGDLVNDHQTLVTGPPPPNLQTTGYPNVVYYCVNRVLEVSCARSLDGGRNFQDAPGQAYQGNDPAAGGLCGGLHGHAITDSKGRLFIPKGHCRFPWIAVSEDGGNTWSRVQVSDKVPSTCALNCGIQTSLAADDEDNLYYIWWDRPKHNLPWLSVSKDHGKTWSHPVMFAPPGVQEVNFPSIDAGKPGHVVITFPGTTVRAASAFRPWNYYFVVSTNALDPIPTFLSTTANVADDPIHRGACQDRCAGMFDFLDATVAPAGEGWGAATDTCTKVSDCITNNGPNVPGGGVAPSALGVAVRQVAGPALRGPDRDLAPSLSATGENQSLRMAGLISLLWAILLFVAVRRSRQA